MWPVTLYPQTSSLRCTVWWRWLSVFIFRLLSTSSWWVQRLMSLTNFCLFDIAWESNTLSWYVFLYVSQVNWLQYFNENVGWASGTPITLTGCRWRAHFHRRHWACALVYYWVWHMASDTLCLRLSSRPYGITSFWQVSDPCRALPFLGHRLGDDLVDWNSGVSVRLYVRPYVRPYVHKKFLRFRSNFVCGWTLTTYAHQCDFDPI